MDHSAGTKRKLELVEPQSQSSEVLGSNEGSSYGQEKKPFNGQSDVGAVPSVDMKSILNEDIHVWLKPPSAYKPTDWGWGVPRGYLIAVKPDGLPSVQLKRVELDFRLRFCPGDTGNDVMSLEIENRTKKIQNRYIVKFDGLLNQLPDMGILPVVPVDSVGWKCLLLGEKCQDLTLPLDLYLSDRMLLNPDKLNHGTELISRVSLNMPRLPWARFYQRVLGDPPKVISDHLDLMNKNGDRIGYYGYSDAVYSFVSELCMRSGDKNRYPASDAVVAEELAATQHPDLVPCLRGYQQRAVRWMLHQECDSPHAKAGQCDELHPLWCQIKSHNDQTLYINPYTWKFTRHRFPAYRVSGGILADEMGLGKTVEVLATVLSNQYQPGTEKEIPAVQRLAASTEVPSDTTDSLTPQRGSPQPAGPPCAAAAASPPASDPPTPGCARTNEHDDSDDSGACLCNDKIKKSDVKAAEHVFCVRCNAWQHKSCVQFNDRMVAENYTCPQCYASREPLPCKTTLIISPSQISWQWLDEIERHIGPGKYKWLNYQGVSHGYLNPGELSGYDIIVTTYHVLQQDLSHAILKFGDDDRPRRHRRRYIAMPSPLIGLRFWRICLDEAQMVENTNAKAAQMANKLSAIHRWCVTGTPVNRGVDDLHGLLYFLDAWPYCHPSWWRDTVYNPFRNGFNEPMHNLLSRIMWRTAKKDVEQELTIPDQTVSVVLLDFEAIEQEYYQRQLEECTEELQGIVARHNLGDVNLKYLNRDTTAALMHPLLALRQSCDHPQAVRTGHWALTMTREQLRNREVLSMMEVLGQLITKATKECGDANQAQIVAANGLAACCAIREQWAESTKRYSDVLKLVEERAPVVATDTVLQLHATVNLRQVACQCLVNPAGTPEDEQLLQKEADLRAHYMLRYDEGLDSAIHAVMNDSSKVHLQEVKTYPTWFTVLLKELDLANLGEHVVAKCTSAIKQDRQNVRVEFADIKGLLQFLFQNLENLETAYQNLYSTLRSLAVDRSDCIVDEARNCHLQLVVQPEEDNAARKKCRLCTCSDLFSIYEAELFDHRNPVAAGPGMEDVQTWSDTPVHLAIKCLSRISHDRTVRERLVANHIDAVMADVADADIEALATAQEKCQLFKAGANEKDFFCNEVLETGYHHAQLFEQRKKGFKLLRSLWLAISARVGAWDELHQAVSRFHAVETAEQAEFNPFAIELNQVGVRTESLRTEYAVADEQYKRAVGRLLYLQNISKADNGMNEETCPICCKEFGAKWRIYACGHCFCCMCVEAMTAGKSLTHGRVNCPMCRLDSRMPEIKFVTVPKAVDKNDLHIKGNLSSKVAAVVRTVMELYQKDKSVKCLLFSNWNEVLNLLNYGLACNGIQSLSLVDKSGAMFQATLKEFRNDPQFTALCLNLRTAGNGLNLIEATHVMLVEPSLKPALEMQAIGRVHRVGQTKPTFVHRFLVRGTVEERLHTLLGNLKTNSSLSGSKVKNNSSVFEDEDAELTVSQLQHVINPNLLTQGMAAEGNVAAAAAATEYDYVVVD